MKWYHHLFGFIGVAVILFLVAVGYNTVMKYKPHQTQVVRETKQNMEKPSEKVTIVIREPESVVPSTPTPIKNWKVREFMGECVLENHFHGITMTEKGDIVLRITDWVFRSFPINFRGIKIGFYNTEGRLISKITADFKIQFSDNADGTKTNATVTIEGTRSRIDLFKNLAYIEVEGQKFSLEGSREGWNDLQKCLTNKQ